MPLTLRNMPQHFTQERKAKMEHAFLRPEDMDKKPVNMPITREDMAKKQIVPLARPKTQSLNTPKPDEKSTMNARPDTAIKAYNPYALGSTVFDAAKYFGIDAFNQEWLKKNRGILNSADENAKVMYRKAYDAEQFTLQAEEELNGLKKEITNRFERNVAGGKVDPNVILENILNGYPALRRMDEGRFSGDLAPLSRSLDYRFEDVAAGVNDWVNTLNKRKGGTKNYADLAAASYIEKDAVIKAEGNALQKNLAPKSMTAPRSILWDKGAAVAWNVNAWFRQDEGAAKNKESGLHISSNGGGMPSTPHPYAGHITEWNALKADAAQLGLTSEYGMPTDQYYRLKGGKPDWMVKADEADQTRTLKENPPMTVRAPLPSVQDEAAADKREAMGNRRYQNDDNPAVKSFASGLPTDQKNDHQTQSRYSVDDLNNIDPNESWRFQDGGWYTLLAPSTSQFESWRAKADAYKSAIDAALTPGAVDKVFNLIAAEPVNGAFNLEPIIAYGEKRKSDLVKRKEDANKRRAPSNSEIQEMKHTALSTHLPNVWGESKADTLHRAEREDKTAYEYGLGSYWDSKLRSDAAELAARKKELENLQVTKGEADAFKEEYVQKPFLEQAGGYIWSGIKKGFADFNVGLFQGLDVILPGDLKNDTGLLGDLYHYYTVQGAMLSEDATKIGYSTGKVGQIGQNIISSAVSMLPNVIMTLMSAGGNLAIKAANEISKAGPAAKTFVGSMFKILSDTMSNNAKNSNFWLSFLRETGSQYENAKARGASDIEAYIASVFGGLLNAAIETSGGLEAAGDQSLLKTMGEEFQEEIAQGVTSRSITATYDGSVPIASLDNPDAILNPETITIEGLSGATGAALLGGGRKLFNSAMISLYNKLNAGVQVGAIENTPEVQAINKAVEEAQAVNEALSETAYPISRKTAIFDESMDARAGNIDAEQSSTRPALAPPTSEVQEDTPRDILPAAGQKTDNDPLAENVGIQPPAQADIIHIEQLEAENDFAAATELRYNTLMGTLQGSNAGLDALATNEGAVAMTAGMVADAAKAQSSGAVIDLETRAKYEQAALTVLGLNKNSMDEFASFLNDAVNTQNATQEDTDLIGTLSSIASMDDAVLKQVLDAFVSEDNLDLSTAQTLLRLMQLRGAALGTTSDLDGIVGDAFVQAASDALKKSEIDTGNPDLDDALKAAAATSHNLDIAMERWGMAGVNYIANLIQAGHAAEAALIVSLPSYANAVIVAEENMRTVALNQDAVFAQENALAKDMQDPYLNKNATQRANQQALAALQSELIDSGALGDYSGLEQEVENAQWSVDDSKADLNHALQEEKAAKNTLAQAQAYFYANMADTNATNAALAAIDSFMEASYGRKKAEQAFASNKRALEDSLQQLDAARQKDMANVQAQAKQHLAELKRQQAEIRAGQHEQAEGQAVESIEIQPDPLLPENVSNDVKDGNPLAPVDERVIINEGTLGETGDGAENAGKPGGQATGARDLIDGFEVIDGKVGGKIPVNEFQKYRQASIINPDAEIFTFGKYTPTVENGVEDWSKPGPDSYIARAGKDSSYFSLGSDWEKIQAMYDLKDDEMFKYFNILALDNAIAHKKTIRFSHNPLDYRGCALVDEWEYLKETLELTDTNLVYEGGFWYVK